MSKQRKAQTKQGTSISSKLLGTSLADINIQKFRGAWQAEETTLNLGGRCTIPLLKVVTNKFSADVMFTLILRKQNLSSIDIIAQCRNLMVLDLSVNKIQSIIPLQNLLRLHILNLSQNSIAELNPLSTASELANLHLEANLLTSVTQLSPLTQCGNLKSIFLQSLSGAYPNPLCSLVNYRQNTLQTLCQVKRLDGVSVQIQCFNQVKSTQNVDVKMEFKSPGVFYTNKLPLVSTYVPSPLPEQSTLKRSMGGCRSAVQELQLKIKMMGL